MLSRILEYADLSRPIAEKLLTLQSGLQRSSSYFLSKMKEHGFLRPLASFSCEALYFPMKPFGVKQHP